MEGLHENFRKITMSPDDKNTDLNLSSDDVSSGQKRLRSTKEYREMKKQQKKAVLTESSASSTLDSSVANEEFVRLVKDAVAKLCFQRFGSQLSELDGIPEWRIQTRRLSQSLLDKESRMPEEIRFNISTDNLRENAVKRVNAYTFDYLKRKYPS